MTERPILFSGAMVRAVLAGTKTQTRRVLKLRPGFDIEERDDGRMWPWAEHPDSCTDLWMPCPYGQPGDRLWVREGYSGPHWMTGVPPREWIPGTPIWCWADGNPTHGDWTKPKPGMHMPRWASRNTLEITSVRVERLQDISEADAQAEGADCLTWSGIEGTAADLIDWPLKEIANPYRNGFAVLLESINGNGSWAENPWVWAVEFRRMP